MNKKQLICLWIGIIIIVFMGIFPPWSLKVAITKLSISRYAFILNPPEFGDIYKLSNRTVGVMDSCLDISKLIAQWFIVASITVGFILSFQQKHL